MSRAVLPPPPRSACFSCDLQRGPTSLGLGDWKLCIMRMQEVSQKKSEKPTKLLKQSFQKSSHPTGTSKQTKLVLKIFFNFSPYS